jgi:hypothetical protein
MKINFVEPNRAFPNGYLEINDARIIWKNFMGRGDRFNREGDRNFHLVIPDQESCELLQSDRNQFGDSWNVKIKPPREEGDIPFMHMLVKVKFNGRGPSVYLVPCSKEEYVARLKNGTAPNKVPLNEDTVSCLDDIDILSVDLDVRPYDDKLPNGTSFRTAYLSGMCVYQRVDRFASDDRYMEM